MFDQPAASLYHPLLQTGQRPVYDADWKCQPSPQIPQIVFQNAEPQSNLIAAEMEFPISVKVPVG